MSGSTATSLISAALAEIRQSINIDGMAATLQRASTIIRNGVLSDVQIPFHPEGDFDSEGYGAELSDAIKQAVDVHFNEDGSQLQLLMLPVVIDSQVAINSVIKLETNSMAALQMTSALMSQLKLNTKSNSGQLGWTYLIPSLYSEDALGKLALEEIVRLPLQAREVVRGERDRVELPTMVGATAAGVSTYFMPVIGLFPENHEEDSDFDAERTSKLMNQWCMRSLNETDAEHIQFNAGPICTYSAAEFVGTALKHKGYILKTIPAVCAEKNISPAALSANLSVTQSADSDCVTIGVTGRFASGQPFFTMGLPVLPEGVVASINEIVNAFKEIGITTVEPSELDLSFS